MNLSHLRPRTRFVPRPNEGLTYDRKGTAFAGCQYAQILPCSPATQSFPFLSILSCSYFFACKTIADMPTIHDERHERQAIHGEIKQGCHAKLQSSRPLFLHHPASPCERVALTVTMHQLFAQNM